MKLEKNAEYNIYDIYYIEIKEFWKLWDECCISVLSENVEGLAEDLKNFEDHKITKIVLVKESVYLSYNFFEQWN